MASKKIIARRAVESLMNEIVGSRRFEPADSETQTYVCSLIKLRMSALQEAGVIGEIGHVIASREGKKLRAAVYFKDPTITSNFHRVEVTVI